MSRFTKSILVVAILGLSLLFQPAGAEALGAHLQTVALDCGYDAASNTFYPIATVERLSVPDPSSSDRRVAVLMRLLDPATNPPTQIAQLSTGSVNADGTNQQPNGTYPIPIGQTRSFRPASVKFGDGALGGGPLTRNYSFILRVRLTDFNDIFEPVVNQDFGCTTSAQTRFQPSRDGYRFANVTDPTVSYASMAGHYPRSRIYFPFTSIPTVKGALFYKFVYAPTFASGLCYGFSATATYMFNSSPPPGTVFGDFQSLGDQLPFPFDGQPGDIQAFIERFHSRQLAQLGALSAIAEYELSWPHGNVGEYDEVSNIVQQQPVTLTLVPNPSINLLRWWHLYKLSHVVVAYEATHDTLGNRVVKVYDPNAPGDDHAAITIDSQGGMTLDHAIAQPGENGTYGRGFVGNIDFGQPQEWQFVALPDSSWEPESSTLTLDNKHWVADLVPRPSQLLFFASATPGTIPSDPVFLADAAFQSPVAAEVTPPGQETSEDITTEAQGAVVGAFSSDHVAAITQTDANASGTTHHVSIDPDATNIRLSQASSQQEYEVTLGADFENYGREVTVTSADLGPGSELTVGTNSGVDNLRIGGTGPSQTVSLKLSQAGENQASATLQASIPGSGAESTISVADWNDVQHSLIYQTNRSGGTTSVIVLQDNPAQHAVLEQQLLDQLKTLVAGLPDTDWRRSLEAKLNSVKKQLANGNRKTAANVLGALKNEVRAQTGKKIPPGTASDILTTANTLIAFISG